MKNLLANLAGLLAAKVRESPGKTQHNPEDRNYQDALRSFAYPLGEYLSDEFDNVEELFDFLEKDRILPEETVALLKHDRQFCDEFSRGLEAGKEDGCIRDEDYDEDEEEDYGEIPDEGDNPESEGSGIGILYLQNPLNR